MMQEKNESPPAMTLALVGAHLLNEDGSDRRKLIAACQAGEPVQLRLEPGSLQDKPAVAVLTMQDEQLGYLTVERSARISELMRKGHEVKAVFQDKNAFGAWIRVAFDGELPLVGEWRE